jgi:hypothetical protein
VLRAADSAGCFGHLLAQLLQIVRKRSFGRIGEIAAAQPIRTALHPHPEIALVRAINRASQLRGSCRLCGSKLTGCRSHLLGEARKIVTRLLTVIHHLVDIRRRRTYRRLAGCASGILLGDQIPHVIGLLFLFGCQLLSRFGH